MHLTSRRFTWLIAALALAFVLLAAGGRPAAAQNEDLLSLIHI